MTAPRPVQEIATGLAFPEAPRWHDGSLWFSDFYLRQVATPEGKVSVVADDLLFPNGCVITPDEKTLIVAETFGKRLTAFDIKPDGSLANRRLSADLGDASPDGICLDAEGAVWVASPTAFPLPRRRLPACWAARMAAPSSW